MNTTPAHPTRRPFTAGRPTTSRQPMSRRPRVSRRHWLAFLGLAIGSLIGGPFDAIALSQDPDDGPTVHLIIDYGDGVEKHFPRLPHRNGMTVLDVMEAAQEHPRGIRFEHRGRGATAFLFRIDDLENEGRGSNWIYRVNDELADRSFGTFRLEADDTILWRFGAYR